uniref:type VI secretion system protein TssA n=1 Tax=Neoroseomonas rubea TaxID=2748666 RepID=UPI0018DEF100
MGAGVLDVEGLLAPLSSGDGVGEDLRPDYSPTSLYQRIRTQRNDARAGERAIDGGDPDADPAAVQGAWRDVKKLGIECLASKAKDFEIACWLTEALVRLDGLAGLADGAEVLAGLCAQYWDNAFPRLDDEDGIEGRGAPLGGLSGEGADGTVMAPIRRFPLFRRGDGSACDFFLWQRAEETAMIAEEARREARYKQGVPQMDALVNEARADVASLRATGVVARTALAAWTAMDEAITARFGGDAPSTRRVNEALSAIIAIADKIAGPPAAASAAEVAEEAAGEAGVDA